MLNARTVRNLPQIIIIVLNCCVKLNGKPRSLCTVAESAILECHEWIVYIDSLSASPGPPLDRWQSDRVRQSMDTLVDHAPLRVDSEFVRSITYLLTYLLLLVPSINSCAWCWTVLGLSLTVLGNDSDSSYTALGRTRTNSAELGYHAVR